MTQIGPNCFRATADGIFEGRRKDLARYLVAQTDKNSEFQALR